MKMRASKDKLAIAAEQNTREKDYWLNRLSGNLLKSTFPYDYLEKKTEKYHLDQVAFRFPPELYTKIVEVSKGADVKVHMILVTGLFILLDKYMHDNNDIIIGSPILKQDCEGEFINTVVVLRQTVNDHSSFKELLLQTRETIITANENQNYPLEILIERLGIPGREGEFPLFEVVLLMENLHDRRYLQGIPYHMMFSFLKTAAAVEGIVEYHSGLYCEDTVKGIIEHYMQVLDQGLSNIDIKLNQMEMLSERDRQRLLFEFNNTALDYPKDRTLHELFENQALQAPDHIALVGHHKTSPAHETHDLTLSYKELNKKSGQLANLLGEKGIEPDTFVGIMVEPCLEMIIGIMGILKAGGAYLPIDPEYPDERIEYMLKDSEAKILVTTPLDKSFVGSSPAARGADKGFSKEPLVAEGINCQFSISSSDVHFHHSSFITHHSRNLAYAIYTSGSTGKPKGVLVEHKNVIANLQAFYREFNINSTDTGIQLTPYSFDVFVEEVFPILLKGGRFIIPEVSAMTDIDTLTRLILNHRVSVIDCTPLLLNELNRFQVEKTSARDNPLKWSYIHTFISGGDVLKAEYIDTLLKIGKVYNTYGPTETTVCAAYYQCNAPAPYDCDHFPGIPIGKPIANYNVYILDKDQRFVPVGVTGELFISGPGVARGYLNNPGLTAEKFCLHWPGGSFRENLYRHPAPRGLEPRKNFLLLLSPNLPNTPIPNSPYSTIYRTGDLARWLRDGNIQFQGRKDQQIKLRGFRVETGEIENRLLKNAAIKEAVVAAREDNEGDKYLCAYIVLNREIDLNDLKESLALELPYYMIPSFFVPLSQLPLTANGKIDRKALPEPKMEAGVKYVEPQNQLQKQMQMIWQEALGLESIGIYDNFFNIGGHSLKGIQVINRIFRELNVKVPLAEMFRTPTIDGLSRYIEQAARTRFVSLEPAEKKEYYPLSSAQKRLYILQQTELKSTAYNMLQITTLGMEIEKGKLEQTFKMLIQRHKILRTSFAMINRQLVQRIHPPRQLEFTLDYYECSKEQINERVENFLSPFDLSRAPLLRVGIIKVGEEYLLMTDTHHIIADGVSYSILIKDFISLYKGEELAPLRLQYQDFCQWQDSETQKNLIKQQESYWLKVFSGEIPELDLPTDYPRPLYKSFAGRITGFELEAAETRALKEIAVAEEVTLYIVLLTIYTVFLAKISRQEDIIVGTSTAGRGRPDLEKIIGMFVNTLALRNYPAAGKTFKNLLKEVGENTIKAFDNGDYPFEELVEKVVKTRNTSRSPLFDVRFTFHTGEHSATQAMPGIEPPSLMERHHTSKFDITLVTSEAGEKVEFTFEYCNKLFKEETMMRFSRYFKEIVSIIIKNKDILLKEIKISHDFITVQSKARQIDLDF